jgi:hypothetical protein
LVLRTKFHDDRFRNSSNIKDITWAVLEAVWLVILLRGIFFKYIIEMASGGMIYIPNLVSTGSGIRVILMVLPQ